MVGRARQESREQASSDSPPTTGVGPRLPGVHPDNPWSRAYTGTSHGPVSTPPRVSDRYRTEVPGTGGRRPDPDPSVVPDGGRGRDVPEKVLPLARGRARRRGVSGRGVPPGQIRPPQRLPGPRMSGPPTGPPDVDFRGPGMVGHTRTVRREHHEHTPATRGWGHGGPGRVRGADGVPHQGASRLSVTSSK